MIGYTFGIIRNNIEAPNPWYKYTVQTFFPKKLKNTITDRGHFLKKPSKFFAYNATTIEKIEAKRQISDGGNLLF